jgi:hypothetical protein
LDAVLYPAVAAIEPDGGVVFDQAIEERRCIALCQKPLFDVCQKFGRHTFPARCWCDEKLVQFAGFDGTLTDGCANGSGDPQSLTHLRKACFKAFKAALGDECGGHERRLGFVPRGVP